MSNDYNVAVNMAPTRILDSRWVRRYRAFFIVGSVILSIQVFLAYKFFPIEAEGDESAQEHRDLSGKGLSMEVSIRGLECRIVTKGAVLLKVFNIAGPTWFHNK
jgi:hypothetical protein